MDQIFKDIQKERERQDQKWGEQSHPSVVEGLELFDLPEEYQVPSENRAKRLCEEAFETGKPTWAVIAVEELCEAIQSPDDKLRREELVQLAAVLVHWIEDIDKKLEK